MTTLPIFNLPKDRILLGTTALWNAEAKWHDRDGLPIPPTPKLVIGMRTILRRWVDKEPIDIIEHPLPDVHELNASVPKPWPTGLNGQEEPPYAVYYVVQFCDPQTGALYTFANKTYGAKLAYERLEEQVSVMRALRGANVVPVVVLDQLPMKTMNFGLKSRPHFQVMDFRMPPGSVSDGQPMPQSPTPQVALASAAAIGQAPAASAPSASASSLSPILTSKAVSTLDEMKSVKSVPMSEMIEDQLPPWA